MPISVKSIFTAHITGTIVGGAIANLSNRKVAIIYSLGFNGY
jgi:hypothetical protein